MHCGSINTTNIGGASLTKVNEGPEKTCSDDIYNDGDGAVPLIVKIQIVQRRNSVDRIFQTNYIDN